MEEFDINLLWGYDWPILKKYEIGDSVSFYSESKNKIFNGIIKSFASGYKETFYLYNIIQEDITNEYYISTNENIISEKCEILVWEILNEEELGDELSFSEKFKGFSILC